MLTYHRIGLNPWGFKHIDADTFFAQMKWVREHCTPIGPEELQQSTARRDRLKPPVLVTFDDGYRDYHDIAYPILKELGIPAVNFISTHFADTGELFWWDEIDLAVAASVRQHVTVPWSRARVTMDEASRHALRLETRREIKRRPHTEAASIVATLLDALEVRRPLSCERQVMTWDEIRAVRDLTTIGGHTHTHPLMTRIDLRQLREETSRCRDRIDAELGSPPTLFAYPSGAFDEEVKQALSHHGFQVGFCSDYGINNSHTDWLQVRRVYAPATRDQLAVLLSGIWTPSKARIPRHYDR